MEGRRGLREPLICLMACGMRLVEIGVLWCQSQWSLKQLTALVFAVWSLIPLGEHYSQVETLCPLRKAVQQTSKSTLVCHSRASSGVPSFYDCYWGSHHYIVA